MYKNFMLKLKKVSVIIPTYNRPGETDRAIKSVLNQTYQNFEIIVVDDSSNNDTQKTIERLNDERIKYTKTEDKKEGSAAARKRNIGVKNISQDSKYIAFLDDDDEYLPSFLEEVIKTFDKDKNLGVVTSYIEFRTTDEKKLKTKGRSIGEFWEIPVGNLWVLRREVFDKDNVWFDENTFFEDLDFGIRIPKNYKREVVPKVLRVYHAYPSKKGESSCTKYERQADNLDYFFKKHLATYQQAGKKALGFLNFFAGKIYCQAGRFKEGRLYFKKALKTDPNLKHFLYYSLALFFPKAFQSHRLLILKHKIFKG